MYLVGLTGGMGSGKSTVARHLAELGARIIDADEVAREVVEPGEPTLAALAERFGAEVVRPDGTLDRAELARRAFVDEESRLALNAITHPSIAGRIATRIAAYNAELDADALVVVDHPLLLETGQAGRFDVVVAVLAREETRVQRLVTERGLDEADVRARIATQVDDDERRAAADHLVDNDLDAAALRERVAALHGALVAEAGRLATLGR